MKVYKNTTFRDWETLLKRPTMDTTKLEQVVAGILEKVRTNGDKALREFTARFDGAVLDNLQVSAAEIEDARQQVSAELKQAIELAKANIEQFHRQQQLQTEVVETMPGVQCWRKSVAIERVGLYIPGGTAPLFSTILMLGIPAKLAGCQEIVLCTPPNKNGSVHPAILYTASLVGCTKIFKVGGAQAIGAMAFGTASVPSTYKIFGPGNQYVTAAKQLVNKMGTAIDMPAGPSEVLVCADESATPAFVAADLLSQAEHGVDSQVVLVAFQEATVQAIQEELTVQLSNLSRAEVARKALTNSVAIVASDRTEAQAIINTYAPEHLILSVENEMEFSEGIVNAGSIFLGNYTPESVGDYASGTNHTLPTNGHARAYSGVSLDTFVKKITFQKLTKEGLQNIGPSVAIMAAAECLDAHQKAVTIRLETEE